MRCWHEETYFVKERSDSKNKYSEDIIKMLESLVDNIFVVFVGNAFQQTVIPMSTLRPSSQQHLSVFIKRKSRRSDPVL